LTLNQNIRERLSLTLLEMWVLHRKNIVSIPLRERLSLTLPFLSFWDVAGFGFNPSQGTPISHTR